MNDQRRLELLDARRFKPFALECGATLDADLCDWVRLIVSNEPSELNYGRLSTLAWYIFAESQGVAFGSKSLFPVSRNMARFQEFVYSVNSLSAMDIPYQEWSSLGELVFEVLKKMAQAGRFGIRTQDCKRVHKHAADILHRLLTDPEIDQRYTDFLNGAL